ncbi:Hint domain-containing protein, partial [Methylobacterium sp.]|uniref:Hint domain-containing protein n=1 Tax=Methylobacterium sp. TaxID=409 RepID=UPI0025E86033
MATTRASTAVDGTQGNDISQMAATGSQVSADGRYVVFTSTSSNLVAGDANGQQDVFVKDTLTGTVTLVSTDSTGVQGNNSSNTPSISADGTHVAFQSTASNLVAGDTNNQQDIFVKDLVTGTTTRVSTDSTGVQVSGISSIASISADGTRVAFQSNASTLVAGDTNGTTDVFVKDLGTGTTTRVSTDSAGAQSAGTSINASISGDGTRVAFQSNASNLVTSDTNGSTDVFVKDLGTGTTTRVSTDSTGAQSTGGNSLAPSISADGTRVAFSSTASNLVAGDTNGQQDVFVKDLGTGTITRVSTDSAGAEGDGTSANSSISGDGTRVAFSSTASNLVAGDTNGQQDVFVKDLGTGATTRVSTDSTGAQTTGGSGSASISGDGTRVAFQSNANNLVADDTNGSTDVFEADVACYVTGTRIRTDVGEVAVEDLRVGDCVLTAAGAYRPIRWIGSRAMAPRRHPRPGQAQPVRIRAGALGENKPARDLCVSPGHALCLDMLGEVLVPAVALVNGSTIVQEDVAHVTYWHVELDGHDILLAEGLPAESYLDCGNRSFFGTGAVVDLGAGPDAGAGTTADYCRPFHRDGPVVAVARARLRSRAKAAGWVLHQPEVWAGVHLEVDGARLLPETRGLSACFVLPADAREIWLCAPTSVPAQVSDSVDERALGLCLSGLTLTAGFEAPRAVSLNDPALAASFHAEESEHRWTAGRARLPAGLLAGLSGPVFLRLDL